MFSHEELNCREESLAKMHRLEAELDEKPGLVLHWYPLSLHIQGLVFYFFGY